MSSSKKIKPGSLRVVYVAGPFSAPDRAGVESNIERAELLGVEVAKLGAMPCIPHSNTGHPEMEKIQPYEFWIEGTAELLRRCDAVIFTPDWERSSGARGEKKEAERLGIPCFFELEALARWLSPELAALAGKWGEPTLDEFDTLPTVPAGLAVPVELPPAGTISEALRELAERDRGPSDLPPVLMAAHPRVLPREGERCEYGCGPDDPCDYEPHDLGGEG